MGAPYALAYARPAAASYQYTRTPFAATGLSQIHKRKAEAEAEPSYGYGYGYPAYGYRSYGYGYAPRAYGYGYGYHKRSAEAEPHLGYGYAPYAPYALAYARPAAASYQYTRTPFAATGLSQIHKREAEAEAEPS